ncbi:MAG TPA: hypothetical protein VH419_15570 [Nocardioidaceae bacterium]
MNEPKEPAGTAEPDGVEPENGLDSTPDSSPRTTLVERPRWLVVVVVTLLGTCGLVAAWLVNPGDPQGFWQNVLIELSGAVALLGVLILLERAMMRHVQAVVRELEERLDERREEGPDRLQQDVRSVVQRSEATAEGVRRLGLAEEARAVADEAMRRELLRIASTLEENEVNLRCTLRAEVPPNSNVLGWHPNNFRRGDVSKQAPRCGEGRGSDRGWQLDVRAAIGARVKWTLAAATRLCPDGQCWLAVGSIVEPINPLGEGADRFSLSWENDSLKRLIGFRRVHAPDPSLSDLPQVIDAAKKDLAGWVAESLDVFYELTEWSAESEHYSRR